MRNAVYAPNFGEFGCLDKLVNLAVLAEKSGFDGFFLWDHINITGSEAMNTVDPTIALAAIASATNSILVGPVVTPLARRRPWKVSRELVSLDHLSKGRVILELVWVSHQSLSLLPLEKIPQQKFELEKLTKVLQ